MSAGAWRRLRIATLGVVAAAATFAACFSALALGFGRQSPEQLEAVEVVRQLRGHAFTFSRIRLAGAHRLTAVCWNGPFRTTEYGPTSAQYVAFSNGRAYVSVAGLVRQVAGGATPFWHARVEIALAGCSQAIEAMLVRRMSRHVQFESVRRRLDGRPVDRYALVGAYRGLDVDAATYLPRRLVYTRYGLTGTSLLAFERRTTPAARLAAARLLAAERQMWFANR